MVSFETVSRWSGAGLTQLVKYGRGWHRYCCSSVS